MLEFDMTYNEEVKYSRLRRIKGINLFLFKAQLKIFPNKSSHIHIYLYPIYSICCHLPLINMNNFFIKFYDFFLVYIARILD